MNSREIREAITMAIGTAFARKNLIDPENEKEGLQACWTASGVIMELLYLEGVLGEGVLGVLGRGTDA